MKNIYNCSVYDCSCSACKEYNGNFYCSKHYQSILKYGHPFGNQKLSCKYYLPDPRYKDDCCAVKVGTGEIYIFDLDDLPWIQYYGWKMSNTLGMGYASTVINGNVIMMHRLILLKDQYNSIEYIDLFVDHKNNNPYDNRKSNLRIATIQENNRNREGINIRYRYGKYYVVFQTNGEIINTGKFDNLSDAIKARDETRDRLYGEFDYFKYLDDGIYARKVKLVEEYDKMIKDMKDNDPKEIKPAFYINDIKTYFSNQRAKLNLPEPITNSLIKNKVPCYICGENAFFSHKGKYYCRKHYYSMRKYGQPFGYDQFKNNNRNIKFKNFNNTGLSAIITADKNIIMIDAEYSDIVFKYNWRISKGKSQSVVTIVRSESNGAIYETSLQLARLIFSQKYPEINNMNPAKTQIEYKNSNSFDLRMDNLICTKITPMSRGIESTIKKRPENGEFRGVGRSYVKGKAYGYIVRIRVFGELLELGYYHTFEEAVQARLDAEIRYYGETFEQISETNKIYDTFRAQVQEWLDLFNPDISPITPFYFLYEDPNKYPKYLEKEKAKASIIARDYINNRNNKQ